MINLKADMRTLARFTPKGGIDPLVEGPPEEPPDFARDYDERIHVEEPAPQTTRFRLEPFAEINSRLAANG